MRLVPCMIIMAGLGLGLTGCSLFNRRPGGADRSADARDATPFKPPEPQAVTGRGPSEADLGGLLAGRVIDSNNTHPAEAYIRWVCLEDKETEAPVDVAVSPEGYFTIQGLKRGKHYKLTARARNGDRMLAGITYTEAPNVRVLIKVSEDFATPRTPPVLPPPTIGKPLPRTGAGTPAPPPVPERIAEDGGVPKGSVPAKIPSWTPGDTPPPPPPAPPMANPNGPAAPVPSCILVGKQLVNFALRDLNGDAWEWKRNRRGKLVLLDFWSTTCVPCVQTVPHLRILQEKYGWAGLEVVAVASEKGVTQEEKAHKVAGLCSRLNTNYRLLLDGGDACPVRRDFAVQYFPTLVLLDENGWIQWRHEGQLTRLQLDDLELRIKRRLGVR